MRFVTSIFLATSVCVFFGHSRAAISLNDTLSTTSRTLSTYRQLLNRTSASLNRNPAFANTSITNSSTEDFVQPKKVTQVYNVWPKNGSVQDRNLDILGIFLDFGLSFSQINCSQFGSDLNRVNFFTAPMTDDQASVLNKNNELILTVTLFGSGVTASPNRIHREVNNSAGRDALYKRDDDGLTTDYDQRPEMVYLSQPRYSRPVRGEGGVPISQLGGQYRYDPSSGAGSIVYMLDTGADPYNPEFYDLTIQWAGPDWGRSVSGGPYPEPEPGDDLAPRGDPNALDAAHGTPVLSKLAGRVYGVVKRPTVVVVRQPNYPNLEGWVDMLTWVIEHWKQYRTYYPVKVAVMNIAVGFEHSQALPQDLLKLPQFAQLFIDAIDVGILPMCAAGNTGQPVSTYPALFADPVGRTPAAAGMMVIGGTDSEGRKRHDSCTAPWVQLTAPGEDIMVAQYGVEPNLESGTSFAVPAAAGVAVGRSALGGYATVPRGVWSSGPRRLKAELMELAYQRHSGSLSLFPLGVYNGVRKVNGICGTWSSPLSLPPPARGKRDVEADSSSYCTGSLVEEPPSSPDPTRILES